MLVRGFVDESGFPDSMSADQGEIHFIGALRRQSSSSTLRRMREQALETQGIDEASSLTVADSCVVEFEVGA